MCGAASAWWTTPTPTAGFSALSLISPTCQISIYKKRQIYHKPGLTHSSCPREFSRSATRNVVIQFSAAALAFARQPGFSALIFSDVKPPTGQSAAYKQSAAADDLHQMGLAVLTENIFFGKPTGRRSERTTMAVVAQPNDGADRWLRSIVSGRPLDGSVMQSAANTGAITLKDNSAKAKVQLLPFDGDAYGVFAFVDSGSWCSTRLNAVSV